MTITKNQFSPFKLSGGVTSPKGSWDHDFKNLKAIRMVTDNNTIANLPVTGNEVDGQWFYANDIKTLYFYEQGWKPIISYGAVTMYVDGVNGTDVDGNGFASGSDAFATIQFAWDNLPALIGGDVIINIAADTYSESPQLFGKSFTGPYDITLVGALSSTETGTVTSASRGARSYSTGYGTITDSGKSWGVDDYKGLLLHEVTKDEYYIIHSNTADTLTIVGRFTTTPVATDTFVIYDWDSEIDIQSGLLNVLNAQKGLNIEKIKLTSSNGSTTPIFVESNSQVIFTQCTLEHFTFTAGGVFRALTGATIEWITSYAYATGTVFSNSGGIIRSTMSWIRGDNTATSSIRAFQNTQNGHISLFNGVLIEDLYTGINAIDASSFIQDASFLNLINGFLSSNSIYFTARLDYTTVTTEEAISGTYNYLNLDASDDLGVGTDDPNAKLDVVGDTRLGDSTTNYTEVESDGDVNFVGGAGLQFAQIYEEDGSSTLALAAQDTFYQITAFTANGESNGDCTPDHTNDHITVGKAGKYLATINISFSQTTAVSIEYDFHLQTNNGANDFPCVSAHRDTAGGNTVGNCSCTGIVDLAANDTVELWVERLTGGAVSRTITIPQCSLTLTQIGG